MAWFVSRSASWADRLAGDWECLVAARRGLTSPNDVEEAAWIPARVPGTAAAALQASEDWDGISSLELDDHDVWYRVRFAGGKHEVLRFEGLATIADVWLNGTHLFRSDNMFLPR